MKINFSFDERSHRRFKVGTQTFRAFWSPFNRRWTVIETNPATGENLDDQYLRFPNWSHVEEHFHSDCTNYGPDPRGDQS